MQMPAFLFHSVRDHMAFWNGPDRDFTRAIYRCWAWALNLIPIRKIRWVISAGYSYKYVKYDEISGTDFVCANLSLSIKEFFNVQELSAPLCHAGWRSDLVILAFQEFYIPLYALEFSPL